MEHANRMVTDVTARGWYQLHYEQCLERYGPDSPDTQGYKTVLDQTDGCIIEEITLKVHYASETSRPQDLSG